MITVGAFEAKTKFSELLDRVERGEEVVITRHGKTVARIVPDGPLDAEAERKARETKAAEIKAEFARTREMLRREGVSLTRDEIIELRDLGRR
ncbi:Antitoxin [Bosea sp. 62]|uniref:type II toxin-antitoxin system Phd/YefM family antitoxin n=1 Tax=unclassified Bosea (in: a-proteobacteria) TaxID=2653178 RepID=UPI001250E5E0|nr:MULTISPECIES: type II toxin-antitoxin system prevent-host-death family antitoxin [unclassified Bosea (in: a-proteobacteria)]CAD5266880.1 Antitoxin [Bosea sp. 46]CAD5268379.1 Antitoxin [Bosea sp. 21B]CAD5270228.1 Antitoxin [Bosea sp. 7B]VVT62406.1 Antitoxin [Bosea sp. EC-HK365B]VXB91751.1 Antitoxin [Bosea sp. 29B]